MQPSPSATSTQPVGRVISLHLHPDKGGNLMQPVDAMELIAGKGIRGNLRYFARRNRSSGLPSIRQVSLIEREQLEEHARALGIPEIPPGAVRANIETAGLDLAGLVGQRIRIGEALLLVCEPRTPCAKMDAICQGLRARMGQNRQGVLAQVIESGRVQPGDLIAASPEPSI